MRKTTKILSLLLVLITVLGLCSGCVSGESWVTLKFGVPYSEDSEEYQKIMTAVEDSNAYHETDFVKIELEVIPEDEEGKKSFLKRMNNGEIAFFFYERDELITPYIESGRLATISEIQQVYPSCFEQRKQFILDTSTDADGVNHMLALKGNYQGVFFNEELFLKYGLQIPKTWEQFQNVIETFKTNGVTPFAAGFADGGMKYWLDELILMEGGVAEHSYIPKYGVINSWTRAVSDLKALYDGGAFNSDCMTMTQDDAEALFADGKAAMIVTNSKNIATDEADVDKMGVFAMPLTTTGKKEIGDIVCDYDTGVYVNSQFLKKRTEVIDTLIQFVIDYLDQPIDTMYGDTEAAEWSYPAYKSNWSMPGNPYTIGEEPIIEDNEFTSPEDLEPVDPTVQEEIKEEDTLQERVFNMMEHVTNAGRPLTSNFKTLDSFTESVKNYIQNGGDINAVLKDATDKEIAAQSGTSAEGEQADNKTE